jgi:hypothetical protein
LIWLDQKASLKITAIPLFLLSKDTKFLNYQNAEILLTAAKKGRDVTEIDIGIEMVEEDETQIC